MPAINKIRFTNIVYEDGMKRYNDELFLFGGHNGAVVLENGGGKTVFIQTALQAVLPHTELQGRKLKQTLQLEGGPAHVAIEWILNERPRRYLLTCISLFLQNNDLDSYRYVYEYSESDPHAIERIPFAIGEGKDKRPAGKGEIQDYYQQMTQRSISAKTFFSNIHEYKSYVENEYQIVSNEWESMVKINSTEGGIEKFFEDCKLTGQLFDRLLIPTVEQSISGYHEHDFTNTFEKHRENFKEYKALKEKIEENKRIEAELDRYELAFAKLHQEEEKYVQARMKAKQLIHALRSERVRLDAEQESFRVRLEEWDKKHFQWQLEQASYEIARAKEHEDFLKAEYQEIQAVYNEMLENKQRVSLQYHSLHLAKYKKQIADEEARVHNYEIELAEMDREHDLEEIRDQFNQKGQELHGYFVQEMERYDQENRGHQIEKNKKDDLRQLYREEKQELQLQHDHWLSEYNQKEGQLKASASQMEEIRRAILAHPDTERIDEQQKLWVHELERLDQEAVEYENEGKRLQKELKEDHDKRQRKQIAESECKQEKTRWEHKREQIQAEEIRTKERLSALKPQWSTIESLYQQADSLQNQLQQTILRLQTDREDLLKKERMVSRFTDDYGEQTQLFADPAVERVIQRWKDQFSVLETGVAYIESLDLQQEKWVQQYKLWPLTLITTDSEKERLLGKLMALGEEQQYPLIIMSTQEIRQMKDGVVAFEKWVTPIFWQYGYTESNFQEWKARMAQLASEAMNRRQLKETELDIWKQAQIALYEFFVQYPFEEAQQTKDRLLELENQYYKLVNELAQMQKEISTKEEKSASLEKKKHEAREKYLGLERQLEKANRYLSLEKESIEIKDQQKEIVLRMEELKKEIGHRDRQLERVDEQIEEINVLISTVNNALLLLKADELYKKVHNHPARYTGLSREALAGQYERLERMIKQVSSTRNEVQSKIDHAKELINNYEGWIMSIRNDHGPLDEEAQFPESAELGEERLVQLQGQAKNLEMKVATSAKEAREKENKFIRQEETRQNLGKAFVSKFPNATNIVFLENLDEIERKLQSDQRELDIEQQQLVNEQTRLEHLLNQIEHDYNALDRLEELHKFEAASLPLHPFSEEREQEFLYKRPALIESTVTELKGAFATVEKEKGSLLQAKAAFIQFCNRSIKDVRMKKMALDGIEHKQRYHEVVEFKQQMRNRTHQSSKIAEETIRTHDAQFEQFIKHIHEHLLTIVQELALIPKQTRVKIGDQWKQIYHFSIPQWQEEEGKERIRTYIHWILDQLKQDKYQNEQDQQVAAKIRKDIEQWLHSKQLLRVVMHNEVMKITCHKVNNENEISRRAYTWEESNAWSGGEKWSKNMTLFLGLLNYTAEKKQHIKANTQTHKAVILDNPFGKASSDHVLSPVFFIAEQLGFQIIALTAHIEGKFLRDYFPVIYSCRLRSSQERGKQIVTKEKWVHHAYFQDHDPIVLERLGEIEQMRLFE